MRIKARLWACFFDIQKESGTSEYTRLTALAPMKRCFFDRDTVKNAKSFLAEQGYVIPYFTQNDLQSEDFVRSFIFYYYTEGYGADTSA